MKPSIMMPCPICRAKAEVITTIPKKETIQRTRLCINGHKFKTTEYILPEKGKPV